MASVVAHPSTHAGDKIHSLAQRRRPTLDRQGGAGPLRLQTLGGRPLLGRRYRRAVRAPDGRQPEHPHPRCREGGRGARPETAAHHPRAGPAAPARHPHQRGIPLGDPPGGIRGRLPRRVPHQGQPAPRGRRGDRRRRRQVRLRPRGRFEARTAHRARSPRKPQRPLGVQRLQGRGIHPSSRCSAGASGSRPSSSSSRFPNSIRSCASRRRWASSRTSACA